MSTNKFNVNCVSSFSFCVYVRVMCIDTMMNDDVFVSIFIFIHENLGRHTQIAYARIIFLFSFNDFTHRCSPCVVCVAG